MPAKGLLCVLSIVAVSVIVQRGLSQTAVQPAANFQRIVPAQKRIVIAASRLFDGKGRVLRNTRIVIEGSKIVAVDPKAGPVDYNLRGLTVLPGWIDSHVHITWSFGPDGKNAGAEGTTPAAAYQAASNAWVTLMAGFTTVQSVGSANDVPLRDVKRSGTTDTIASADASYRKDGVSL
jgi:imidazolonepropionase-like amidohydrolase